MFRPKIGTRASGGGDLEATLTFLASHETTRAPAIAFAGEIKFPTAKNRLIGTGRRDYALYVIGSKKFGDFDIHGNLGYTIVGKPVGAPLKNILNVAVGGERKFQTAWSVFGEILANTASSTLPEAASQATPEAPGGEIVGSLGLARYVSRSFRLSMGVSVDNNDEAVAGAAGLAGAFLVDRSVRTELQADRSTTSNRLASVGNVFGNGLYALPPLAAAYILGRVVHRPCVARAAFRAGTAFVLSGAATGVLKAVFGRARPFQRGDPWVYQPFSRFDSFPSGHVTVAVATAVALAAETDRWWLRAVLYGSAGLTGYARMNDDKHWLSDVVAGAVVGIVAGRLVTRWGKPARVIVSSNGLGFRLSL